MPGFAPDRLFVSFQCLSSLGHAPKQRTPQMGLRRSASRPSHPFESARPCFGDSLLWHEEEVFLRAEEDSLTEALAEIIVYFTADFSAICRKMSLCRSGAGL